MSAECQKRWLKQIDGEIEHREIAFSTLQLEPHWIVRTSFGFRGAFDQSVVPCSTARGVEAGILGFPWAWSP
jgi:hypothetical protein